MKKVTGVNNAIKRLNAELDSNVKRAMAGLLAGGMIIEVDAKKRVPREYGNLFASSYTRKAQDGTLAVEVGFTSAYALWVHENIEMKLKGKDRPSGLGQYWGPKGEAKYLENALNEKKKAALDMVIKYAGG
jgi:hypothetical protein